MRTITVLIAAASLAFVFARSPEERTITDPATITSTRNAAARPVPIDDLFFSRGISGASWSPDGKEIVFGTNLTGRFNLWKVSASGGWPVQLAVSDDRQGAPMWSPDGKWILWQQDRGGNEAYDIYIEPSSGGAPVNVTSTADVSETNAHFSPDSSKLAIDWKPVKAAQTDIAIIDLATKSVRNLTNEKDPTHSWSLAGWTRDGSALFANRLNAGFTVGEIYRIDLASGRIDDLTPNSTARIVASSISPDGRTLLITSNENDGYDNVALLDVATKNKTWITDIKWEASSEDFSPDGKWITLSINEDGRQDQYIAPVAGGPPRQLAIPAGVNSVAGRPSAFSPDGSRLLVVHQSSTAVADFWIYDLASNRATQLTHSAIASLDATPLPPSQIVHYKSFDGTTISALLWMPFNLERNGRNPGIVLPHGGPTGQTVDSFNRSVIALVSRGYTV